MSRIYQLLFLCTGNSARSILGEALANHYGPPLRAFSCGSQPKGQPHPLALSTLQAHGISTDGLRSKSWDEFSQADSPKLDFVFTVCGSAADETCPLWVGAPLTAHWGVPDPPAAGDESAQVQAFEYAYQTLKRRIARFAALPLDQLTPAQIREHAVQIGRE